MDIFFYTVICLRIICHLKTWEEPAINSKLSAQNNSADAVSVEGAGVYERGTGREGLWGEDRGPLTLARGMWEEELPPRRAVGLAGVLAQGIPVRS